MTLRFLSLARSSLATLSAFFSISCFFFPSFLASSGETFGAWTFEPFRASGASLSSSESKILVLRFLLYQL
jgi:hypothetical protein